MSKFAQDLIRLIYESTLLQGEQPDKNVITINKDVLMQKLVMYLVEHDQQLVERARMEGTKG